VLRTLIPTGETEQAVHGTKTRVSV
jgi:hypothetical protein